MTIISVSNLNIAFGNKVLLENLSFSLNENDKLGIVGVNGSGKTTLFKLILGEYDSDDGSIFISKDKTIGVLRQDGTFYSNGGKSALEVMYGAFPKLQNTEKRLLELSKIFEKSDNLNVNKNALDSDGKLQLLNEYNEISANFKKEGGLEYKARCVSILKHMGYTEELMNFPLEKLSGGQKTRLSLAVQLCTEPDILLLDEPTNHLDIETLNFLETFLLSYKKCVIVISHDRYFLDKVTNKTLIIENQTGRLYEGGYSSSLHKRNEDRRAEEKHYKEQQKEIARQEAYIAQQRQFNRERNIIAAESRLKLLEKMDKIERPKEEPKPINLKFKERLRSGNDVMEAKNLAVGYNGIPIISKLNFTIKRQERVFIIGPNGCGKSTLVKTMVEMLEPILGNIKFGYNVVVGYYDQENQNLNEKNTVLEELWHAYPYMKESEVRSTLASFRFLKDDVFKMVAMLSGGERARLTLAKLILSEMNLLILDEPTNHLDIDSKEALENALMQFDGTIIAVSHDRYFIDKLATRIIAIKPGSAFDGDFFDYKVSQGEKGYTSFYNLKSDKENQLCFAENTKDKQRYQSKGKDEYLKAKKKSSDSRKEQKRLENLKNEAAQLESELDKLTKELYGEASSDYVRAASISNDIEMKESRLLDIYEEIGI